MRIPHVVQVYFTLKSRPVISLLFFVFCLVILLWVLFIIPPATLLLPNEVSEARGTANTFLQRGGLFAKDRERAGFSRADKYITIHHFLLVKFFSRLTGILIKSDFGREIVVYISKVILFF